MFSVNPRVTVGRISFPIVIQKSEKQWKVLRVCLEKLLMGGPPGNQTFLRGCTPQKSLNFSRQPFGLSSVYTTLLYIDVHSSVTNWSSGQIFITSFQISLVIFYFYFILGFQKQIVSIFL